MFYTSKLQPMAFVVLTICMACAALLCLPENAHAGYLDPGSGSVLVQTIIAVLAFFGRMVDKIKAFFSFKRS